MTSYAPPPARIDRAAGLVYAGGKIGEPQAILYTEGHLIVHADLRGAQWGYSVTAICGYCLGTYRLKSNARKAARILSNAMTHPAADSLKGLFGSEEQARAAYDAVRPLMA